MYSAVLQDVLESKVSVRIWPTPTNDVINYEILNQGERILQSIQLTSSKGQTFSMNGVVESTRINIAEFPSGIYIFEFRFDDGAKASKRFVKL